MPNIDCTRRGRRTFTLLAAAVALAVVGGPQAAFAQAKKPAAKAEAAKPQSAWVKLCEKAPVMGPPGADGKPSRVEKDICLTHHERLDGNTGVVIVSAALRQVEGSDKRAFMVMVPLGMALPPGLKAAVYPADLWAKAQKNEKIDEKRLKPIELKFTLCHPAGCTAEVTATPEWIADMKKGAGIMILAVNASGQPLGFPVPLEGFAASDAGKPIDNKVYAQARSQLMGQIRDRQRQIMEEAQKAEMAKRGVPAPKKN